jgi:hypothetical protein
MLWKLLRTYVADEQLAATGHRPPLLLCRPPGAATAGACPQDLPHEWPVRPDPDVLELSKARVAKRVNFVSQAKLPDNWG